MIDEAGKGNFKNLSMRNCTCTGPFKIMPTPDCKRTDW